jgi:hypothetical protein
MVWLATTTDAPEDLQNDIFSGRASLAADTKRSV